MNLKRYLQLCFILASSLPLALAQSGGGFGGSSSGGGGGYSGGGGGSYYGGPVFIGGGGGDGGDFAIIVIIFIIIVVASIMSKKGKGGLGGNAKAVKVQLLLAEGDEVKKEMQRIARSGNPHSADGLAQMLSEAAVGILRQPGRWMYGHLETKTGSAEAMNAQVGYWESDARSRYTVETTSNYGNFKQEGEYKYQKGGVYLAVTLLLAARDMPEFATSSNTQNIRQALMTMSGMRGSSVVRIGVVWSPDQENEFLTEDEAIQKYPELTKI